MLNETPDLVDFAVSYGECSGYCTTVLHISAPDLELVRISDEAADPDLRYTGTADEETMARIGEALDAVCPADLEAVYGRPDSRDEGAATVRLMTDRGVSEHRYSATDPPPPLRDLHDILTAILHAWLDGEPVSGVTFDSFPEW